MSTETGPRPPQGHRRPADRTPLLQRFDAVRGFTDQLREPLSAEDCAVQSCFEASPVKWHLAHTTWFFEIFLLRPHDPAYQPFSDSFDYLFNSYYNAIGDRQPKEHRGIVSRPSLDETLAYRDHVNRAVRRLVEDCEADRWNEIRPILEIGLHHEQQHQELILTDVKHLFASNPLKPAYHDPAGRGEAESSSTSTDPAGPGWIAFEEGLRWIGHDGPGFAYDNESPRHRVFLEAFEIADRPVTNAEFRRFIEDGGYERPELWLDEGWATVQQNGWRGPLYWAEDPANPRQDTLAGPQPIRDDEPVCHISFYEAEAFARWAGARLPTEQEWETACAELPIEGNLVESGRLHPAPAPTEGTGRVPRRAFGDVWEWTRSAYEPYPGYRPPAGALGEYNGKFMCSQYVLRGGSCVTPESHIRPTYRNFFHPHVRWQFSGLRLARDRT